MRYRTAVKTGRTAALQLAALRLGSFAQYAAMVQRLCDGRLWRRSLRGKTHAVWIMALLLLVGAFAGDGPQAQDKDASSDASITRQVERALAQDRALGGMHIKVETQNAVVSLTGFVRSLEDITKAGGLAKAVRGVSAVRNGLRVANRPSQA
jgi:hypothetical protein